MKELNIQGLSESDASHKLKQFGSNQIVKPHEISFFGIAKEEITEPLILLLFAVGLFYGIWGKLEDALTIFIVITILVFVEVWNEYRAKKAISSLSKLAAPKTKVLRDGKIIEINTEFVVPDDILILTTGTRIAADCKVFSSYSLQIDESSLTGESFPKDKKIGNEIYAGTLVVSGEGRAKVLRTGKNTKIGRISALAQEVKQPKTPLQLSMKSLSKKLIWVALFFSVFIPLLGFVRGQNFKEMILTGLSLSFATVPEELPIIITMVLGLGAYKLSKQKFLVKKLKAAETLGNATIIVTDKTGTITENKLQIAYVSPKNKESEIISSAIRATTEISSSPIDKVVLNKASELGINKNFGKIIGIRNFSNQRKTRSVLRSINGKLELFVIGAPEEILTISKCNKSKILKEINNEASKGRMVIGIAKKMIPSMKKSLKFTSLEKDLNFVGLISFEDPPRDGVKETIKIAKKAGIKTIMVTGDHPQTASYIAKSVGIDSSKVLTGAELDKMSDGELQKFVKEVSVFARATPEHKYRIVKALHQNKEIVAVTGDGVNDVIALKEADIGISMGVKGTDAAKEVADAVLADDNFVNIGHAIFEGRKFFDNLKKGVKYYLSVKTALILVFLLPVIFGLPFPFAPIQIIVLELFMDLAASSAFVAEPAERTIYNRKPRVAIEKFMNRKMIAEIFLSGFSLFALVMISYYYARLNNLSLIQTQTFAFTAWIIGHIILALISRSENEPLFKLGVFSNKIMNIWVLGVIAFLFVVIAVPSIGSDLKLTTLSINELILIFGISFAVIVWQELIKIFRYYNKIIQF